MAKSPVLSRIVPSIFYGWAAYLLILGVRVGSSGIGFEVPGWLNRILLWNFALVYAVVGHREPLGYDHTGRPIYTGTSADIYILVAGVIIGAVAYPIMAFLIMTLFERRPAETEPVTVETPEEI